MKINITGHHIEITTALHHYVHNKFEKIYRHFPNITQVYVILSVDKKFQQKAEAQIHLAKGNIFADAESEDMYAAIDALIDKLDRQVIKHKEKMNDHGDGAVS